MKFKILDKLNFYNTKKLLSIFNFISLFILILNFTSTFTAKIDGTVPTFQNNEIIMVAPAESCWGVTISQPTTLIEKWDYKNDILELKSWRHFLGNNNTEERVALASVDWKLAEPNSDDFQKNFKTINLMYDVSGPTAQDYYSISCAKKTNINGKISEPVLIDCKGALNISNFKESDKYLRCNSQVGPLAGYKFEPLNMNLNSRFRR